MAENDSSGSVGVFDSGIGGLSVLRELVRALPDERFCYLADQANIPYGKRPLEEVERLTHAAARFFLGRQAKVVILACHTASAAALWSLRREWPETPFVGLEPAVKVAAETTRTGRVGVLATAATFMGELYRGVVDRFAKGVDIFSSPCPGLVEMIEAGDVASPELSARLDEWLAPMKAAGIDRLVLGCTHFPLIREEIQKAAGPEVMLIDPAPAIARRARDILEKGGLLGKIGEIKIFTTGDPARLGMMAERFLHLRAEVCQLAWSNGELTGKGEK